MPALLANTLVVSGLLAAGSTVQSVSATPDQPSLQGPGAGAAILEVRDGTPNPHQTLLLRSSVLDENRQVYVQLPTGYEHSKARYPLLFVMDAEWLFDLAVAHVRYYSFDEVTDQNMPRMIVVGIANTDRDRNYTPTANSGNELFFPTAGKADDFLRFLEQELIPLLDERYRTTAGRALAGWSFSGLFSAYAAVEKPDLFDAHLCISPAIWWDHDLIFERMKTAKYSRPKRMVFTLGSGEAGGWVFESTKRLLRRLEQDAIQGLTVTDFEFEGVGHTWGVASAMDKGLQALFSGYIAPGEVIEGGLDAIHAYYKALSRQWGYTVKAPNNVLRAAADKARTGGNPDEAVRILKEALSNDPDDSLGQFELGSTYEAQSDPERALHHYRRAIQAEQLKAVPNQVNLRDFRTAIAGLPAAAKPQ